MTLEEPRGLGHGTHLITGRVQNERPHVLMIRLEVLRTIQRRISLWWLPDWSAEKSEPVACRRWSCAHWGCPSWALGRCPATKCVMTLLPGSLSEMFLQYLVSSHSLPPFSSILRFPASGSRRRTGRPGTISDTSLCCCIPSGIPEDLFQEIHSVGIF